MVQRVLRILVVAITVWAATPALAQLISTNVSYTPRAMDPVSIARDSTLIVAARVAKQGQVEWLRGQSPARFRGYGTWIWHDFEFDQVKVIWPTSPGVRPLKSLLVRVLGGQTGSMGLGISGQPRFEIGERYILCLTDVDGLTGEAGPAHWCAVNGTHGAFQITPSGVIRKGVETEPSYTLRTLAVALAEGARRDQYPKALPHGFPTK